VQELGGAIEQECQVAADADLQAHRRREVRHVAPAPERAQGLVRRSRQRRVGRGGGNPGRGRLGQIGDGISECVA